uniref:Coiled-coil domain containing 91 n=2 Tax=Gopherus evgoodei TaxID=1825980 RepID=A0A8C4XY43_9SAUR
MDDDDFGGFEAAVTFEGEDGETQTISPAIPWAAFPAVVSEVHVLESVSSDVLLENSLHSACLVSSDSLILSGDDVLAAVQTANNILNPAVLKEQVQLSASSSLDISIPSLSLTEGKPSENSTIPVGDSEKPGINGSKKHLHPTLASLEIKLKDAEEEKCRIKKDLEDLMEKHSIVQTDFLKEKEGEFISHQDRYKKLQEKHKLELEDMRKAGHEALTIIVEEFKIEKEVMQEAILKAVEEERRNMEKIHAKEREIWQTECDKYKEKIAQAVQEAVQEQRKTSQEVVKAEIMEERKRSEKAVEEVVKRTREELIEYIKEQKRLDQVVRQRSLCSLELFLSCAQKQLSTLLKEEPITSEQEKETENLNHNENM